MPTWGEILKELQASRSPNGRWRQAYNWVSIGGFGFCFGQWATLMWPEWSPWTWFALSVVFLLLIPLPTIWDHRKWLFRRLPQQGLRKFLYAQRGNRSDSRAVAVNPGNGWRVARMILSTQTPEQAEALFRDFMAQPHKDQEERVFAAYWVQTSKLRGVNVPDCWHAVASAAVEHGRKTGDTRFWDRTIREVVDILREVYKDAYD